MYRGEVLSAWHWYRTRSMHMVTYMVDKTYRILNHQ